MEEDGKAEMGTEGDESIRLWVPRDHVRLLEMWVVPI